MPSVIDRMFSHYYMRPRPEWNRLGPRLPLWFRLRLRKIDSRLRLQFVPPNTVDPAGVPARQFPNGVWYIVSRLRRTRWVSKRAVFSLVDPNGNVAPPTMELIKILAVAKKCRKRGQLDVLERQFEDGVAAMTKARADSEKAAVMQHIIDVMRKIGMRSWGRPRVYMPHAAATA